MRLEPPTSGTAVRRSNHRASPIRETMTRKFNLRAASSSGFFDLGKNFRLFEAFPIKTRTKKQKLWKLSENMAWLIHCDAQFDQHRGDGDGDGDGAPGAKASVHREDLFDHLSLWNCLWCLNFAAFCPKVWPPRRRHRLLQTSADNSWLPSFSNSRATKRLNLTPFSQITGSRLWIDDLDTFIPPLHHKIEQKSTNLIQ